MSSTIARVSCRSDKPSNSIVNVCAVIKKEKSIFIQMPSEAGCAY